VLFECYKFLFALPAPAFCHIKPSLLPPYMALLALSSPHSPHSSLAFLSFLLSLSSLSSPSEAL
jgi:hypothetical protein